MFDVIDCKICMFFIFMTCNLLASAMILQNYIFCDCKSFYALDHD
jgi:hypothetical protein